MLCLADAEETFAASPAAERREVWSRSLRTVAADLAETSDVEPTNVGRHRFGSDDP